MSLVLRISAIYIYICFLSRPQLDIDRYLLVVLWAFSNGEPFEYSPVPHGAVLYSVLEIKRKETHMMSSSYQ